MTLTAPEVIVLADISYISRLTDVGHIPDSKFIETEAPAFTFPS